MSRVNAMTAAIFMSRRIPGKRSATSTAGCLPVTPRKEVYGAQEIRADGVGHMKYLEDYFLGPDEYEFELPKERQERQDQQVYRDGEFWLGVWILISITLGILGFFAKPLTYAAMIIIALTMRLFQ
jgi:hypothetical protein